MVFINVYYLETGCATGPEVQQNQIKLLYSCGIHTRELEIFYSIPCEYTQSVAWLQRVLEYGENILRFRQSKMSDTA